MKKNRNNKSRLTCILIGYLFIYMNCGENDLLHTPPCLLKSIQYINEYVGYQQAYIIEYEFQNGIVYYIDSGDGSEHEQFYILNSNCDSLGYLGGAVGNSIINGEDFYLKAKKIRTIWGN
ncbi:MAG: hypothetical protein IPM92_04140 [Saprospiraceae bacterium]|nr:hypothetical protein [Saprospiraceae bacterium]